jgi:K+-sensing histidine kinase KdpD
MKQPVAKWSRARVTADVVRLLAAAAISTLISTLIASLLGGAVHPIAFHALFIVVAGLLGVFLGSTRLATARLDSSFLFVFFLFEPMGRVLLAQEAAPADLAVALVLALAAAYLLGRGSCR